MPGTEAPIALRWLGESRRSRLREQIHDATTAVVSQWSLRGRESMTYLEVATEYRGYPSGTCYGLWSNSTPVVMLRLANDALCQLLQLPADARFASGGTDGFLAHAEQDFAEALLRKIAGNKIPGTISVKQVMTDDVRLQRVGRVRHLFDIGCNHSAPCGQLELFPLLIDLLMPRDVFMSAGDLSARRDAIGRETVSLTATIGHVELAFTELHELSIGDVLVLTEDIHKPALLNTATGRQVAEGILGRHQNQIALQISALAASNLSAKRSK